MMFTLNSIFAQKACIFLDMYLDDLNCAAMSYYTTNGQLKLEDSDLVKGAL